MRWPRPGRNRSGMAIVEFAMGSSVLLAAFFGTFEIGYSLIQYNELETAVAQGARYASIIPYDSATATPSTAFSTAVKNMVLYGSPVAGTSPVVSGLTSTNVNLTVTFANGVPSSMQVSISGYTINALFGTYTLTGKPQVTYPYLGVWAPV
jgi:Flp pilus assembly protein TadG